MSVTLLIPSAATVPDEMKLDVGPIPTGMISLHGQPVLKHIIDSFNENSQCDDVNILVAHQPQQTNLINWVETSELDIELVAVESPKALAHTVLTAIDTANARGILRSNGLYIQFADTLVFPPCIEETNDYIVYDEVDHPIRWTTFETNDDGKIESVSEKFTETTRKRANTFVGQFWITSPREFRNSLSEVQLGSDQQSISDFYLGLLSYLSERTYSLRSPSQWIDVGHLDTYYQAKLDFLNTREFNDIQVDSQTGVLRKQSDNSDILNAEVNWYSSIPPEIQPYTPEIYDYELGKNPYVRMEYIGYPPLSDIYMYGHHGKHIWRTIFRNIFTLIEDFQRHSSDEFSDEEISNALESMYIGKTINRLDQLRNQTKFEKYFEDDIIVINGDKYTSVSDILERLSEDITSSGLLEADTVSIIHGDLCFPNILYDIRAGSVKLIDPRGEFGNLDIYGDYRYDLAKLIHSVKGHYEFIINDRFSVEETDDEIDYTIHRSEKHRERERLFDSLLESRYPDEIKNLFLIECLLWLSMVPLHSDSPKRQLVMLAQGIEKYNQTFLQT